LPEHWTLPGVQMPEHAPLTHALLVQAAGALHCPVASQLCTPLPLHCVCPGAQTPAQAVPAQVWLEHAAGAPHAPEASHVSTPFPEHCSVPGVQATHALLRHAGCGAVHIDSVCQLPIVSQD
jgi:hypothetical protein